MNHAGMAFSAERGTGGAGRYAAVSVYAMAARVRGSSRLISAHCMVARAEMPSASVRIAAGLASTTIAVSRSIG
ncbi:hypothetical protein D3C81_1406670 [compost metagenome]